MPRARRAALVNDPSYLAFWQPLRCLYRVIPSWFVCGACLGGHV